MIAYDPVLAGKLIAKARDGTYERNQLGCDLADQLEAAAKEVGRLRGAALHETQGPLAKADREIARRRPLDPTTAAMTAQIDERDHFRIENVRLARALIVALAEITALKAERHPLSAVEDPSFAKGYAQAAREIRDHFAKVNNSAIVVLIEETWLKKGRP